MPLSNGNYTLANKGYPNSTLNLLGPTTLAPITGLNTPTPQQWKVKSTGGGKVSIQSISDAAPYASVDKETENVGIIGSANSYDWVAVDVAGEDDTYVIKSVNAKLIWNLTSNGNYAVVVLKTASAQYPLSAKWVVTAA